MKEASYNTLVKAKNSASLPERISTSQPFIGAGSMEKKSALHF